MRGNNQIEHSLAKILSISVIAPASMQFGIVYALMSVLTHHHSILVRYFGVKPQLVGVPLYFLVELGQSNGYLAIQMLILVTQPILLNLTTLFGVLLVLFRLPITLIYLVKKEQSITLPFI